MEPKTKLSWWPHLYYYWWCSVTIFICTVCFFILYISKIKMDFKSWNIVGHSSWKVQTYSKSYLKVRYSPSVKRVTQTWVNQQIFYWLWTKSHWKNILGNITRWQNKEAISCGSKLFQKTIAPVILLNILLVYHLVNIIAFAWNFLGE